MPTFDEIKTLYVDRLKAILANRFDEIASVCAGNLTQLVESLALEKAPWTQAAEINLVPNKCPWVEDILTETNGDIEKLIFQNDLLFILKRIAGGAFGDVFLVWDRLDEDVYAVKRWKKNLQLTAREQREARLVCTEIVSPYIVKGLDFNLSERYLKMEYLPGN